MDHFADYIDVWEYYAYLQGWQGSRHCIVFIAALMIKLVYWCSTAETVLFVIVFLCCTLRCKSKFPSGTNKDVQNVTKVDIKLILWTSFWIGTLNQAIQLKVVEIISMK